MKKQAKSRILTCLITLMLALSLIVSIPNLNAAGTNTAKAQSSDYGLADNVQDGVILHAWNWSYNTIKSHLQQIAEAGYTTVQTSPVQQPKDYNASYTNVSGQWWKLYQPVSFSIAENSWIGTASELSSLCSEADKYGVKIICDIVVNHMGNNGNVAQLSSEVAKYEPTIYNNYTAYFHKYRPCSDSDIVSVVQGNIGMPDLNTGNSYVQERVISLLKQCIDCGVDGFRFDAAKHIETSRDGKYASNFWDNVIGTATSYAKSKKGISLYCYGEILNTPGNGRSWSDYTSIMSITDNVTGNNLRNNINGQNASGAAAANYNTGENPNKLVIWAESHDTYADNSSSGVSTYNINKTWAIAASRADASALYFARPGSASMGQCGSEDFADAEVSAVNHFHNHFVGAKEYLSSSGSIAMNERYKTSGGTDGGAVLVNVSGGSTTVSNMTVYRLGDGTYKDQITGNTFTVSNGKISGSIGNTGIAVVYNDTTPTPTPTKTPTPGETATVYFTNNKGWNSVYAYYWGGENPSSAWPGEAMTKSYTNASNQDVYEIEVPTDVTGMVFSNGSGSQTVDITSGITDGVNFTLGDLSNGKYTVTQSEAPTPTATAPTATPSGDKITVYFTNNYNWNNVYCYYWGSSSETVSWPGTSMTYVEQNEYNQAVYSITLPSDVTGIIFNSGNGGVQTVDITSGIADGIGYYITGGSSSPYSVGTYTY